MCKIKHYKLYFVLIFIMCALLYPKETVANKCLQGNCENGFGTYLYSSGKKYKGNWREGKRHGKGAITYAYGTKYDGEWKNDKMHGKGNKVYSDGSSYTGTWVNGHKHGKGSFTSYRGIYEGEWKHGKREGRGKMMYRNNTTYNGEWKNDFRQGKGIIVFHKPEYKESAQYIGEWKNDNKNGKGVMIYFNSRFEGEWKNNIRQQGDLLCPDGSLHKKSGIKFVFMKEKNIKEWRIRSGYDLEHLSKELGVTVEKIRNWESSKGSALVYEHVQLIIECLSSREK
jgi:hypothetical protein